MGQHPLRPFLRTWLQVNPDHVQTSRQIRGTARCIHRYNWRTDMSLTSVIIPSPERDRCLNEHVPYRIKMLQGLDVWVTTGRRNSPLEPVFPSIFESAVIACRWSGNFLGLCATRKGVLHAIEKRHARCGDVFSIDLGGTLVDPNSLAKSDAELLGRVCLGANVATAHPTREGIHPIWSGSGSAAWDDVRSAAPLLVSQIKLHLYDVLSIPVPEWKRPLGPRSPVIAM